MDGESLTELRRWRVWFVGGATLMVLTGILTTVTFIYADNWTCTGLLAFASLLSAIFTYLLLKSGVSLIWHGRLDRSLDEVVRSFENISARD